MTARTEVSAAARPIATISCKQANWLEVALGSLETLGFAIVEGVLEPEFVAETRDHMYAVQERVVAEVGGERLSRAGEIGVLRLMMKHDSWFVKFLELDWVLQVIDRTVSSTAIMHLQNGFILPSLPGRERPEIFQHSFHMDFPRVLNGYLASINVFFAVDDFSAANGATLVVPGSHQKTKPPETEIMARLAVPAECSSGSMILFDSTLWHAAGYNTSGTDRLAINHQFTRAFIKQQIDYVRALGDSAVTALPPRSQQLLGYYTRIVTSLDEYYRPESERLYRKGQG